MNGTSSFYKHPSLDVVARQQQPCYLPTEQAQQPPSYNQTSHFNGYPYSHQGHAGMQSSVTNNTQSMNFETNHNSYYKIKSNSHTTNHNDVSVQSKQIMMQGNTKQSLVHLINSGKKQSKIENKRSKAEKKKSKSSENDIDNVNPCFPECSQSSQNRLFTCPKCSKTFKRGDHLKRHLLSVHDKEHPYQCGDCQKGFPSVGKILHHSNASHACKDSTSFFCARCQKRFGDIGQLEKHAQTHHLEEDAKYMCEINNLSKTFSCSKCKRTSMLRENNKKKEQQANSKTNSQNVYKNNSVQSEFQRKSKMNSNEENRAYNGYNYGVHHANMDCNGMPPKANPHFMAPPLPAHNHHNLHCSIPTMPINSQSNATHNLGHPTYQHHLNHLPSMYYNNSHLRPNQIMNKQRQMRHHLQPPSAVNGSRETTQSKYNIHISRSSTKTDVNAVDSSLNHEDVFNSSITNTVKADYIVDASMKTSALSSPELKERVRSGILNRHQHQSSPLLKAELLNSPKSLNLNHNAIYKEECEKKIVKEIEPEKTKTQNEKCKNGNISVTANKNNNNNPSGRKNDVQINSRRHAKHDFLTQQNSLANRQPLTSCFNKNILIQQKNFSEEKLSEVIGCSLRIAWDVNDDYNLNLELQNADNEDMSTNECIEHYYSKGMNSLKNYGGFSPYNRPHAQLIHYQSSDSSHSFNNTQTSTTKLFINNQDLLANRSVPNTFIQNQESQKAPTNTNGKGLWSSLKNQNFQSSTVEPVRVKRRYKKRKHDHSFSTDDIELEMIPCPVCGVVFEKLEMMGHIESTHLVHDPNKCCICGKTFAQAGNAKRHVRLVHLHQRPYECKYCYVKFDRPQYLDKHIAQQHQDRVHLKKPVKCPVCLQDFISATQLRRHFSKKHMSAQIKLKDRTKYDEYVMVYKSLCTNTSTKKELVNDRSSTDSVILENRISTSTKHYLDNECEQQSSKTSFINGQVGKCQNDITPSKNITSTTAKEHQSSLAGSKQISICCNHENKREKSFFTGFKYRAWGKRFKLLQRSDHGHFSQNRGLLPFKNTVLSRFYRLSYLISSLRLSGKLPKLKKAKAEFKDKVGNNKTVGFCILCGFQYSSFSQLHIHVKTRHAVLKTKTTRRKYFF